MWKKALKGGVFGFAAGVTLVLLCILLNIFAHFLANNLTQGQILAFCAVSVCSLAGALAFALPPLSTTSTGPK